MQTQAMRSKLAGIGFDGDGPHAPASESRRYRRELDVAAARLGAANRLGGIRHWQWNPSTGEIRCCDEMVNSLALSATELKSGVDALWQRIEADDRERVRDAVRHSSSEPGPPVDFRVRLPDGRLVAQRLVSVREPDAMDGEWISCAVRDLADGDVRRLAYFDPLTGLPNRGFLNEHLRGVLQHARRHDRLVALLQVNLAGFKRVNETLGHTAGDRILQEVAERLRGCVRDSDCVAHQRPHGLWPRDNEEGAVARFGSDEFIVVLSEVASGMDPDGVAERVISALCEPMKVEDCEIAVGACIGIAVYPEDAEDEDTLVRSAGLALKAARGSGWNAYRRFDTSLRSGGPDALQLEARLRHAVVENKLRLHYQPKVETEGRGVVGAEALLRWHDDQLGDVSPYRFIPVAESSGLIVQLGEWVVGEVCRQLAEWRAQGVALVPVSINVSAQQLYDPGLRRKVSSALEANGLRPENLEFEVTESTLMDESGAGEQRLHELRELGSKVSMDDFGTGYSSLSYLKRLPIDVVKIDRSFVRDILSEEDDQAILCAIIAMAHQLRLRIVAEGVESDEQAALLRQMDCDMIQGYVVSRPLPAEQFASRFLEPVRKLAV